MDVWLSVRPPVDLPDPYGRLPTGALTCALADGGHLDLVVYTGFPSPQDAPPQGEAMTVARVTYRPGPEGEARYPTFPEVARAAREADAGLAWNLGSFNAWEPVPDPTENGVGLWITGVGRRSPHLVRA